MVLVFACLIPGGPGPAKGAAVGLFTYIAFFGATWLPLPWLYPAEINPLKTRAKANATSTVSNWIWNFFIVMITPVLISSIGWGTYLFFAVLNAIFLPILGWSVALANFWRLSSLIGALLMLFGLYVGARFMVLRSIADDKTSYVWYNVRLF